MAASAVSVVQVRIEFLQNCERVQANQQTTESSPEEKAMKELDPSIRAKRPEFRNINAFSDLPNYRLPLAGLVSILHRISGALMFVLLPFIIWMFDVSVSSEISYARFTSAFSQNTGLLPGWILKLVALALIWAFLHHLIAGLRHLRMDMSHAAVTKESGKRSAAITLVLSIGLTLILGAKLFGAY
jgi:succinate dehydrogenase / fumarate reductase cytochrome b subunit